MATNLRVKNKRRRVDFNAPWRLNLGRLKSKPEVGSSVSASCETLGNAAPVEKTSYHRFDVVSSAVLPVEIVGVFPDIDNPKWCDSCAGDGSLGIWRAHDG